MILKVGQNFKDAESRVLGQVGIELRGTLYDTLLGHYCLHPCLDVGLDHLARFYLGDVKNWKGMAHDDPHYNALDVLHTWHVWKAQLEECARRPMSPLPEIEARCRLIPLVVEMETTGMRVDVPVQRALIESIDKAIAAKEESIETTVKELWAGRVEGAMLEARVKEEFATHLAGDGTGGCPKHPKSNGLKKPRACLRCWEIYDAAAPVRERYKQARADKSRAKGLVGRWQEGFNWASTENFGWLLYEALGLPEQINRKTKKRTTDAQTVARLMSRIEVARNDGKLKSKYYIDGDKWKVIAEIKATQGLNKDRSFVAVPLSDDGYYCWPKLSYKLNGPYTGRWAGGEDKGADTDKLRAEGGSLMNVPVELRHIYIPPPHHIFVAADYSNQEGRLAAYISGDQAYIAAFDEEDRTGIDVHSQMAATIFNIDPRDARTFKVTYKGVEKKARDVGKAANHASSYTMDIVGVLHGTFGMPIDDAVRVAGLIEQMRPQLMRYKRELVERILGSFAVDIGRTGKPRAARIKAGMRYQTTPFGWQRYWYGEGRVMKDAVTHRDVAVPEQANDVLAFGLGQAPGASVHALAAHQIRQEGVKIAVTNYDNFVGVAPRSVEGMREVRGVIERVMTQPWPQLGGRTLPVELKCGMNWGDYSESNPEGLRGWDEQN